MNALKRFVLLAVLALSVSALKADVLYWQLKENPNNDQYAALVVLDNNNGNRVGYAPMVDEETGTFLTYTPTVSDAMSNVQYADISNYTGTQYSFVIETLSLVDNTWKQGWTSEAKTYAQLSDFIHGPLDAGELNAWNNASIAIPEPTSGLLLLVGGSLLALRRKRRA